MPIDQRTLLRPWLTGLLWWGLLVWLGVCQAGQRLPESETLTHQMCVLEDREGTLTWQAVVSGQHDGQCQSVSSDAEVLNLGYSSSAFWVRVVLRNGDDPQGVKLLELGYNRLSWVDLYVSDGVGGWIPSHTGNLRPFDTRAVADRNFVWPVQIPPGGQRLAYLRLQTTSPVFIPLRLWSAPAFFAHERTAYVQQAVYYGMALAMVGFNLLLFLALRDRAYLYYVLFVASMAFSIAVRTGLAKEFLPIDSTWWWESSSFLSNSLASVTFLVFMRKMLQSRQHLPRWDRWIQRVAWVHLLLPVLYVPLYRVFAVPMIWVYIATLVFILGTGMYGAWRRLRAAYFFAAAFAILFVTAMLNSLTSLGWLPANIITNNLLQFGSACEMILLAFALADRINSLRHEKLLAQGQMLTAQQELVKTLQDSERVLEARVQERTNELQHLNLKLEALSMTDGLTGIANRRRFDDCLESECKRAQRAQVPLGLGLIDIDWFKRYNDTYGHQQGDACLRAVAQAISAALGREQDFVARYGGEEFVFLAPALGPQDMAALAEKIRASVAGLGLAHSGSPFEHVTLSIGAVSAIPAADELHALLQAADAALYAAKEAGRNCVVLAPALLNSSA